MNVAAEFEALLKREAEAVGKDLSERLDETRRYAAERMLELSKITDPADYAAALQIEVGNVALKSGIEATDAADAADAKLIGVITGALAIGARALSPM